MMRKSQRVFPLTHHWHVAKKLVKLDSELREVIGVLRGSVKAKDAALKCQFWLNRFRGALDNQLLRDFPAECSPSVYFPGATPENAHETMAPVSEPIVLTKRV